MCIRDSIEDLLLGIEKKKEISGKLSKGDLSYVMSTFRTYYDKINKNIIKIAHSSSSSRWYGLFNCWRKKIYNDDSKKKKNDKI